MSQGIYLLIDGRLLPDEELVKVCEKELALEVKVLKFDCSLVLRYGILAIRVKIQIWI